MKTDFKRLSAKLPLKQGIISSESILSSSKSLIKGFVIFGRSLLRAEYWDHKRSLGNSVCNDSISDFRLSNGMDVKFTWKIEVKSIFKYFIKDSILLIRF